jgi:GNAT superfamily N-acetyltransferase
MSVSVDLLLRGRQGSQEVDLFIIFTHPDYRRKGIGQQFMNWGKKKADEMNVDLYLDSTPYGRPLYEANGFEYIEENVNIPVTDNPDASWKQIEEKVGPFTFWLMRRPVNGKSQEGLNNLKA